MPAPDIILLYVIPISPEPSVSEMLTTATDSLANTESLEKWLTPFLTYTSLFIYLKVTFSARNK